MPCNVKIIHFFKKILDKLKIAYYIVRFHTANTFDRLKTFVYVNRASVAQLVELLICNQWVGGSSPFAGSS